ncbi:MAG: hypothetical protein R3C40_06520 [Parvularculaceae bacterium]
MEHATKIARAMVTQYGLSEKLRADRLRRRRGRGVPRPVDRTHRRFQPTPPS